jgi:alkylated DNA repair dioxygenase AlkB
MDCDIKYIENFLTEGEIKEYTEWIENNILWTQVQYPKYNKIIKTPRLTTCFGFHNDNLPEYYANYQIHKIPNMLIKLKNKVEDELGEDFNYVLMSYYRDGKDSISYHSDDERFLGKHPTIASISLGQTRRFLLKNKKTKETLKYDLETGSLAIMGGNTQTDWMHSIPKTKRKIMPRINITFRNMKLPAGSSNYYKYNRGEPIGTINP